MWIFEEKLPSACTADDFFRMGNYYSEIDDDVISSNKWKRPIYYTSGGFDSSLGLEKYYRTEGLAYRLVPVETPYESIMAFAIFLKFHRVAIYERMTFKNVDRVY